MVRHPTRFSVARFSGFLFLFIFFDGQFRLFSFSDSNTYLDTEISIISLRFGGLEITLVWFSPLFTRVSLCLHFTFLSLTMARGPLFKILFFASVEIRRAETSGLAKRITALSCSIIIKIWDIPESKLGVISTAKTAHNQGANNESPKLYNKSYFARHFYAVLKLWVTGKCMCNIKSIGTFARLYCFLENCWNLEQFRE